MALPADRGTHSEESRLANLLRRVSREDDRDRRLATLKQLKEIISHGEIKVVSLFLSSPCPQREDEVDGVLTSELQLN